MSNEANSGSNLLKVDLTSRQAAMETLSQEEMSKFIGGGGMNAWLLYGLTSPDTGPLDQDNPLIFGAGPLVGTSFPTGARTTLTSLSPLTGIYGDANGGGMWGVMMRRLGIQHLVITGALDQPGYLVIAPQGKCAIEKADEIWGLDTLETEKFLKNKYPRAGVAVIGPAGENQVRYANLMFQSNAHSFSRAGMGAVMGAKKLKAIVLLPGKEKIQLHDAPALSRISQEVKTWAQTLPFARLFTRYGTMMFIHMVESLGLMYAHNWRRKADLQDIQPLDPSSYFQTALSKDTGCFRCPLRCGKEWRIKQGDFAGEKGHGYEVAYIITLGLTLGLKDVGHILHLANLINRMGFDINEFCGAAGMVIDACEQGILRPGDLEGIKPSWGDVRALEELAQLVAAGDGFGRILAKGTRAAAKEIGGGAEQYALHMKGMHWPAHSAPPFVMAFSLSTRGGDFLKGIPHLLMQAVNSQNAQLLFGGTAETMNYQSHADKGRAVWWHENYKLLLDSLGVCFYLGMALLTHGKLIPAHLAAAYEAASGAALDGAGIQIAAERGYQMQRVINALRGLDRRHDSYTKRPEPDSWAKGIDMNKKGMLDEYYAFRGLSSDGLPTPQRLTELGLDSVAQDLKAKGRLGELAEPRDYLPLAQIIKNPAPAEFGRGLKMKLQNRVRTIVMAKLEKDVDQLRQHFSKISNKRRKKEERSKRQGTC